MWPDWSGRSAVIVGTGPSAAHQPFVLAKDRARFIVIKSSWRLAPWADVLYGLDRGWWIANQGANKFHGMKVSPSPTAQRLVHGMKAVRLRPKAEMLNDEIGVLGCGLRSGGGNSGFQAINLAIQFGARHIILAGFEMNMVAGAHWKPDDRGVAKASAGRMEDWRIALDGCAAQIEAMGVRLVNCTPGSSLKAFPVVPFADAIAEMAA